MLIAACERGDEAAWLELIENTERWCVRWRAAFPPAKTKRKI
jgi:hypothetical protein